MKLIYANWKLNKALPEAIDYTKALFNRTLEYAKKVEFVVFPSHTQLFAVSAVIQNTHIQSGAQDCSMFEQGAYTGEVSALMCAAAGASYVLLGHSERRIHFRETEDILIEKFQRALDANLEPVYCIGENLDQRKSGETQNILKNQLDPLKNYLVQTERILIAYEPVWAIGTGLNAHPDQIQEAHAYIEKLITEYCLEKKPIILYGGSVNRGNIKQILSLDLVSGVLVGGASLNLDTFIPIIEEAAHHVS